jgi:hypothetical protein
MFVPSLSWQIRFHKKLESWTSSFPLPTPQTPLRLDRLPKPTQKSDAECCSGLRRNRSMGVRHTSSDVSVGLLRLEYRSNDTVWYRSSVSDWNGNCKLKTNEEKEM